MRILVFSCAEDEFAEAVDYYNEQRPVRSIVQMPTIPLPGD